MEEVEFLVLPATSKHDIILGRVAISNFNAHPSTAHGEVGVPTRTGVAIIHVNRHCFATESSRPDKVPKKTLKAAPEKWPADMAGVPRSIAEHKLRVNSMFTPIVQKKQKMGPEQTKAMNGQVQDLLHAGIIRESKYQTWVANPIIFPKSNGTWRMCIDFKDLSKACPKDCYPLQEIDLKVDDVAPFKFICFLTHIKATTKSAW
ncbi:uncharacterized protein LOC143543300 [Bidens hawaiensis]|uniref:uncharacterized protein LOC143543300 n=1 Tax=Bidens hawaiensis TaxID=980011 RepID=UPI00404A8852